MIEEHQHTGIVYSIDSVNKKGLLVCDDCCPEELKQGNACYCKCHEMGQLRCPACVAYHRSVQVG